MLRRRVLLATGATLAAPAIVRGQSALPDRGLRLLVGYPSGGGTDLMVRLIAPVLQRNIGRHVAIENRPGTSGATAALQIAKAEPDGTIVGFITNQTPVGKLTKSTFPFDPQADLAPLTLAGTYSTVYCISPKSGATTVAEYVQWLKEGPSERRRFGITTPDSFTQYFGLMVGREIGVPLEAVPYNGAAPLVSDIEQGRIFAGCGGITSFLHHHRGNRVKILLTSGARRMAVAKGIPTATELGYPKLQQINWYGFFAPPGLPQPLIATWNGALHAVLHSGEVAEQLAQLGLDVETSAPDELKARLAVDFRDWKQILDSLGIKPTN